MQQKYIDAYNEYEKNPFVQIKDLEEKYGFNKSSFYRALKKSNISLPKKTFNTTCDVEKLEIAVNLYNKGYSINRISKKLNMGEKTISKYLTYLNVEIRQRPKRRNDLICNHDYFTVINNESKAYWLGFIYADGCIKNKKSFRLSIELSSIDENHLKKFKNDIESNHDIKHRKDRTMSSISINSKKIVNDLCNIGCIQNKTEYGHIDLSKIPRYLYKDFLRGFLDGDGYIDKTRYRIVYTIKTKSITYTLQKMFKEVHIDFKIKEEGNYHRLFIEDKDSFFKTLDVLYSNSSVYLDRKMKIYQERIKQ